MLALNNNISKIVRDLAGNCGIDVDEEGSSVYDHSSYASLSKNADHKIISTSQILRLAPIFGSKKDSLQSIYFQGVGLVMNPNIYTLNTLVGEPSTFSLSKDGSILVYSYGHVWNASSPLERTLCSSLVFKPVTTLVLPFWALWRCSLMNTPICTAAVTQSSWRPSPSGPSCSVVYWSMRIFTTPKWMAPLPMWCWSPRSVPIFLCQSMYYWSCLVENDDEISTYVWS